MIGRAAGAVLPLALAVFVSTVACGQQDSAEAGATQAGATNALVAAADGPLLDRLDADRAELGRPELSVHPDLMAVAYEAADRVSERGGTAGVDLGSDALAQRLAAQGYSHRLLVVAHVVGGDEWQVADDWPDADPATWQRLMDPKLRDVGIGRGTTRDGPFLLLLAALSQNDAKAAEAAGLAELDLVRARVLELVNERRRREGLVELKAGAALDAVSQEYAERMLRQGYYGHESPGGENAMDRIRAGGLSVRRAGENLAEGPPTPESVVQSWYDSPTHRSNLLHRSFRRMGLGIAAGAGPDGVYRILWVQMFSSEPRGPGA